MRFLIGPAVAVIVLPLAAVWLLWFDPSVAPLLRPITQSPVALLFTGAIYIGFVALAVTTFLRGWRQMRREQALLLFLRTRIDGHAAGGWTYVAGAEDTLAAQLFTGKQDWARQRTSAGRVVALLHADARFFRFEPVHLALRTEAPVLSAYSTRIASYQMLAVRAGILMTFVGLIESLSKVQDVFMLRGTEIANSPNAAALTAELGGIRERIAGLMGEVVQGLTIAFGSSISGILAAFVIFFLASEARQAERRVAEEIQAVCQKVQKLFRDHTNQNAELMQTAEALRSVLKSNLGALNSANRNIHENAERLSETARELGEGLGEPVRLFAGQTEGLRQLLEQSAAAAAVAREVSASLEAAEAGAARRMETIAAAFAEFSERSHRQIVAAVEASGKAAAETGEVMAGRMAEATRALSGELLSGLGGKLGGALEAEVLTALRADLSRMHAAHADAVLQIRREGRRESRLALVLSALLVLAAGWIGLAIERGRLKPTPTPAPASLATAPAAVPVAPAISGGLADVR